MPTPRETILAALYARLLALPANVLRGDVLAERILADGGPILRDGETAEFEPNRLRRSGTGTIG